MGLQAVLGGVLVAYGIAKIALAVVDETPSLRARVPYLDAHYDGSTAGHALRAFLVAFGVYTVVHGLALLQVLPAAVGSFAATFAVYGTIGVLMTAFFGLVVYGPRGVNRDPAYAGEYRVLGLGGGLMFLTTLTLIAQYQASLEGWSWDARALLLAATATLGAAVVAVVASGKTTWTKSMVVHTAMIPLGAI